MGLPHPKPAAGVGSSNGVLPVGLVTPQFYLKLDRLGQCVVCSTGQSIAALGSLRG